MVALFEMTDKKHADSSQDELLEKKLIKKVLLEERSLQVLGVFADTSKAVKKGLKIRLLFGHCFVISHLESGDNVPVGGSSFSNKFNKFVKADFDEFDKFFASAHKTSRSCEFPELKSWLDSSGFDIDEKLFASLYL